MKIAALSYLIVMAVNAMAEDKVTLCGNELAKARVLLCYGAEYVMKRGMPSQYDMEDNMLQERRLWTYPGIGDRWGRNKRGLVDECCLKPCKAEVILSYC